MRWVFSLIVAAVVAGHVGAQSCPGGQCQVGVSFGFSQSGWPAQTYAQPPIVFGVQGGYGVPSYGYGAPAWSPQPYSLYSVGSCFGGSAAAPSYGYGGFAYQIPDYQGRVSFGQGYATPDWRTR